MRKAVPAFDERFPVYPDHGCDLHPSCLSCPLPRCRYDEPGWLRRGKQGDRDARIVEARGAGRPVKDVAARFGVSQRTVHRVLAAGRGAPASAA